MAWVLASWVVSTGFGKAANTEIHLAEKCLGNQSNHKRIFSLTKRNVKAWNGLVFPPCFYVCSPYHTYTPTFRKSVSPSPPGSSAVNLPFSELSVAIKVSCSRCAGASRVMSGYILFHVSFHAPGSMALLFLHQPGHQHPLEEKPTGLWKDQLGSNCWDAYSACTCKVTSCLRESDVPHMCVLPINDWKCHFWKFACPRKRCVWWNRTQNLEMQELLQVVCSNPQRMQNAICFFRPLHRLTFLIEKYFIRYSSWFCCGNSEWAGLMLYGVTCGSLGKVFLALLVHCMESEQWHCALV